MIAVIWDSRIKAGPELAQALDAELIDVRSLEIKDCTGCNSCSGRTFGRCVLKDDMSQVLRILGRSEVYVFVGPLTFGSYSSSLKRVIDRFVVLGDPRYYVVNGELVKGTAQPRLALHAVTEEGKPDEEALFRQLHHENIRIMNCSGEAFFLGQNTVQDIAGRISDA